MIGYRPVGHRASLVTACMCTPKRWVFAAHVNFCWAARGFQDDSLRFRHHRELLGACDCSCDIQHVHYSWLLPNNSLLYSSQPHGLRCQDRSASGWSVLEHNERPSWVIQLTSRQLVHMWVCYVTWSGGCQVHRCFMQFVSVF